MKEGWQNDEYFVLCESQDEAKSVTERYRLHDYLPGYFIVGLKGWDDFILSDSEGNYHVVPTVPLTKEELRHYSFPATPLKLQVDGKFTGRVKWYVKPTIFGGSPTQKENIAWLSHDQHVKAVIFWNKTYFDVRGKTA